MPEPFRIAPQGPVRAYKTYKISSPITTHYRAASCEEVDCEAWKRGWTTRVPFGGDLADYVTSGKHGRRYREVTGLGEAERTFMFYAGQACFQSGEHRVSLERPALYVVRDGDWRGNPTGHSRLHARPEDWVEDFALHQQGIADRVERG